MATVTKHYTPVHLPSLNLKEKYERLISMLDFAYFATISFTISLGSIFGGAGLMFTFGNHAPLWQPITGMIFSLASNVAAIAQAPMRWVFNLFVLNILVNGILILINAF